MAFQALKNSVHPATELRANKGVKKHLMVFVYVETAEACELLFNRCI
jgi:hypothetical protein